MTAPILTTKLSFPPLRTKMVERTALIQKLNQGIESGFVLISAPAGYGKTTLVSAWLHQMKLKNTWLTLDRQDDDPVRFLTYLAAALKKIDPAIGEVLEIQLQNCPFPIVENCLTPVINKLNEIEHPFWLILDDYHVINNQSIHQIIRFLLDHRPYAFHLVITTRADPPLPLSKYRAKSELVEIRLADLRFSTAETEEFFEKIIGLNISSENIAILEAKTEGWAAGLLFAGVTLQSRADLDEYIQSFCGTDRYFLDFLFDEIFQGQSEEVQKFLLQTSILERLCSPLCDEVTAQKNSQSILTTLERNNLFLIPLDDRREWYRYHHLFRDLLINRVNQVKTEDLFLLHARAGSWFLINGYLGKAIEHLIQAQDFEQASNILEQNIQKFDFQNQQTILSTWLDQIPQSVLIHHPWLSVYRAWGNYWSGNRGKEEEWLDLAEQSLQTVTPNQNLDLNHIHGHIAAVRAHIALMDEDITRAKAYGEEALLRLPINDVIRSEAAIALAGVYWALGDVKNAEASFRMAVDTAREVNYASMAAGCMGYVGIQLIKQGKMDDAKAVYEDGLKLAILPKGSETPMAGFLNIRLGDLWRERNVLHLANENLTKGLELCKYLGQPDILTDAYICCSRYQLAIGNLDFAKTCLHESEEITEKTKIDPWILCWLNDLRIRIWTSENNIDAINHWVNTSGLSFDQPLSYQYDLHHQNLARAVITISSFSKAYRIEESVFRLLDRLYFAAKQAGWVHEQIKILIMESISLHCQDNAENALNPLMEAIVLAEPSGYQRVFLDEGERMHVLLGLLEKGLRSGVLSIPNLTPENGEFEHPETIIKYIHQLTGSFSRAMAPDASDYISTRIPEFKEHLIDPLTAREMDVLKRLAMGYPDKKIAEELFITQGTVHKHLKNIYSKLDVHNRTEAVARAQALSILPTSP